LLGLIVQTLFYCLKSIHPTLVNLTTKLTVISHGANIMLVRRIVATDAMGYVTSVAQAIVDAKADYVL